MGQKNSCSSQPKEICDVVSCTDFTEEEAMEWYNAFAIESGGEGKLSLEEFQNVYKQLFPNGDSSAFAEHVFR